MQLAVSMAAKAGCLAKEVKSIKMDLCFMQERCLLLEEENRRLREGLSKGLRPEEDDLVMVSFYFQSPFLFTIQHFFCQYISHSKRCPAFFFF